MTPFASKIWPGSSDSPGTRSSVPVEMTAALGRLAHDTAATPAAASAPSSAGRTSVPARTTRSPAARVASARPDVLSVLETRGDFDCIVVLDHTLDWTTASAPSGTTPPVAIAIDCPAASGRVAGRPAAMRSTTGRRPACPSARTANPSIAELGNGGRSTAAVASAARTRPAAAGERNDLTRQRPDAREDLPQRLLEREQGRHRDRILGP
jgi:hypothetical protein